MRRKPRATCRSAQLGVARALRHEPSNDRQSDRTDDERQVERALPQKREPGGHGRDEILPAHVRRRAEVEHAHKRARDTDGSRGMELVSSCDPSSLGPTALDTDASALRTGAAAPCVLSRARGALTTRAIEPSPT